MRRYRWIGVVWACFLARLLFYAVMLPLWEGYDEWAHFSVVRRVAEGAFLVRRDAPVPRDVEASLALAPVPWEMRNSAPPAVTEDAYWQLPESERARRREELRRMSADWARQDGAGGLTAYEALQPPLYYWTVAPVLWVSMRLGAGLIVQVVLLRIVSVLIASAIVPLVFLVAREVWREDAVAVGCAAVAAVMPGLAFDVARVGNDCLAVALFTLLTWLLVRRKRNWAAVGLVLGLGLLTKAYFLAAIPVVVAAAWFRARSIAPGAVAAVVAGWWYVRNVVTTGTFSGLSESAMLRGTGTGEMLRKAAEIHWAKAVDAILLSHLYFGGWSSITVRSWMYHLFYLLILVAAVGLVRAIRPTNRLLTRAAPKGSGPMTPSRGLLGWLAALYASFWVAQFYNVVLLYMSKGLEGSMGWYLYAMVGAEVTLCTAGLRQWTRGSRWVTGGGAALFALLDLYTVYAVAIPYYTGMIRHRVNGTLEALHGAAFQSVGLGGVLDRLGVAGPAILAILWLGYLAGTMGAVTCAWGRKA